MVENGISQVVMNANKTEKAWYAARMAKGRAFPVAICKSSSVFWGIEKETGLADEGEEGEGEHVDAGLSRRYLTMQCVASPQKMPYIICLGE